MRISNYTNTTAIAVNCKVIWISHNVIRPENRVVNVETVDHSDQPPDKDIHILYHIYLILLNKWKKLADS